MERAGRGYGRGDGRGVRHRRVGAGEDTAKPPEAAKVDAKPGVVIGQKTGYFNMAK